MMAQKQDEFSVQFLNQLGGQAYLEVTFSSATTAVPLRSLYELFLNVLG
jgi:hypothetical protein